MPKINLSSQDLEEIESAIKDAESNTSGEIAAAFIKESDSYAIYELMFSLICGFIYFFVMMFFTGGIEKILKHMTWDYHTDYLLIFYGLSTFMVIFIFYLLANINVIDRLIIPKSVMQQKVDERAMRHFMEAGVYDTKDRTGILIFISHLEHRVELLADKGISKKIPQEKWHNIVNHIIAGVKSGRMVKHLTESIAECGKLLAEHYPIQPDDVNELKNNIAILEK
ncbi:MAG TPA: TPM domain-containing protein [Candidatus Kapabacteria bacterium]|nr:TPM domain-containing protein [Candidatus Kapabacteria bacterium]